MRHRPPTQADLDLMYTEARAQLDVQIAGFDALDVKAGIVLALSGTEATVVAAALAIPRPDSTPTLMLVAAVSLVVLSLGAFAYVATRGILSLATVTPAVGVELEDLALHYARGDPARLVKARAIRTLRDDFLTNEAVLYRPKARRLRLALIAIALQTMTALVALFLLAAPSLFQSSGSSGAQHPGHSPAAQTAAPRAPSVSGNPAASPVPSLHPSP